MSLKPSQYKILQPFEAWVQQSLPAVYDDSLSYTDLLAKMLAYLNSLVENNNALFTDMKNAIDYINNYFDNLDVQDEINNKLDKMAEDGTLSRLIQPLFDEYKTEINAIVAEQNNKINQLSFFVTPEMFYKTSDGDDWSYAIQACIDYARENKVEIHLKGRTYNCDRKLLLKDGVRMIGADAYNTVLKYNGTGLFITQASPETTGDEGYSVLNYVELKCIIIRGSDIQGSIGMHLVNGSTIRLYEMVVEHFDTNFILGAIDENKYILNANINVDTRYSNHPMIIRNVEDTIFTNCVFDCKRGIGDYKPSTIYSLQIGDNTKSGAGAEPFDIIFIACVIQNADYGIYHDGSYNVAFTAGHAEYCSTGFINQTYHGDEPLHFFGFKIIEIPNNSSISGVGVINYSEKNITTRRLFSSLSGETVSLGAEGTYVANSLSFILPPSLIAKPRFFRIIVSGYTSSQITLTAYLINKKNYSNIIQPIDKSVSSEFTFDSGWESYDYWTNDGDELNVIPVLHGNNNSQINIKSIDVMYYN